MGWHRNLLTWGILVGVVLSLGFALYGEKVTISLMMWGGAIEEQEVKGYLAAFPVILLDEVAVIWASKGGHHLLAYYMLGGLPGQGVNNRLGMG